MNWQHSARRVQAWGASAIWTSSLLLVALAPASARAVTVSGTTYAANTGGPGTNPATASYNFTSPTTVSASIRSDVTYSHAQSWASATVTCAGVTKTTGGRGWADTP